MNLPPEIELKLRNLGAEDVKKVTGFFCLLEAGDKQATEIWSMANNKDIEPRQVADLIYDYMTYQGKSHPKAENIAPLGRSFHLWPVSRLEIT